VSTLFVLRSGLFFENNKSQDVVLERYARNITWDTEYRQEIPYKKNERIEKVFIFKNTSSEKKLIRLKQEELSSGMDNSTIVVNNNS